MAEKMISIPFGKPARVGNYKVWRSRQKMHVEPSDEERRQVREKSQGGRRAASSSYEIEQINISNLDGSWQVKIPQTTSMFGTLTEAYNTADEKLRDSFMTMLFCNMQNVCLISSEALHDAFFFLTEMMSMPYLLLSEEEMCTRMRKAIELDGGGDDERLEEHISKMCEYRRQLYDLIERKKERFLEDYERQQEARRAVDAEEQMHQDEMAEQAADIINEN